MQLDIQLNGFGMQEFLMILIGALIRVSGLNLLKPELGGLYSC
jgi:hypothetical protein